MLSAETAITRLRRDLAVGLLIRGLLVAGLAAAMVLPQLDRTIALLVVGGVWLFLATTSAKGTRASADAAALIMAGRFDEAEEHIDQTLKAFNLFRTGKLQALHHLALLRHAQRRWGDSAMLCGELLRQRLGNLRGLTKPARLLLADASLEINDLSGAHLAITGLYAERLSLIEALNLLRVQLDYEARIGAWDRMMAGVMSKAHLAELMPAEASARSQALLAVAASRTGRADFQDWLRRRAEHLADPSSLMTERPLLRALWPEGGNAS